MRRLIIVIFLPFVLSASSRYFVVRIVDEQTKRGVPLVELRTLNDLSFHTDSNGIAVIDEEGFKGREMFFVIRSHGYEYPREIFDYRGEKLKVVPGKTVTLTIRRKNVAERLYRITGEGIYRDSVMAGLPVPIERPLLNGEVLGQDTVSATVYRGRIFWIWGDTFGPANANFSVAGATSSLPGGGGLDPSAGINLHYLTDSSGFTRAMLPLSRPGLVWIEGLFTVKDHSGRERLVATYTRQPGLKPPDERGIAVFNDEQGKFEVLAQLPPRRSHKSSHPFRVIDHGRAYWRVYPNHRVSDDWDAIQTAESYESYTCLRPGTFFDDKTPPLDRNADGRLLWGWKAETDRVDPEQERRLIEKRLMRPDEALFPLVDVDTGEPSSADFGSIAWNEFRKRYIMIAAFFGTTYYSEADRPEGPWRKAKKVVEHEHYNFYNVAHHPFFDQEAGRVIYFEGTYTDAFTDAKEKTPRYNYNQIMYRLRLDDPRLKAVQE